VLKASLKKPLMLLEKQRMAAIDAEAHNHAPDTKGKSSQKNSSLPKSSGAASGAQP